MFLAECASEQLLWLAVNYCRYHWRAHKHRVNGNDQFAMECTTQCRTEDLLRTTRYFHILLSWLRPMAETLNCSRNNGAHIDVGLEVWKGAGLRDQRVQQYCGHKSGISAHVSARVRVAADKGAATPLLPWGSILRKAHLMSRDHHNDENVEISAREWVKSCQEMSQIVENPTLARIITRRRNNELLIHQTGMYLHYPEGQGKSWVAFIVWRNFFLDEAVGGRKCEQTYTGSHMYVLGQHTKYRYSS